MDSDETREPRQPPSTRSRNLSPFAIKPVYLRSILILVLAILFSVILTSNYKIYHLRSALSSKSKFFFRNLNFFSPALRRRRSNRNDVALGEPSHCVLWMAPFLSGGGYSSEAWSYILALNDYLKKEKTPRFRLSIEQHGDSENVDFWEGLSLEMRNLAIELYQTECRVNETIVVCHSEPGAWYPPLFETLPCPPARYDLFEVVIGRTMFETDRVNAHHVKRCNNMDYVWVPTDFHVDAFVHSGVDPLKVKKVVQPVDLEFFDPLKYEKLDLESIGKLVVGLDSIGLGKRFVFLSVFKWEFRKGWDVLLKAYLKEFSGVDGVALCLLTNPYHTDKNFGNKILEYVKKSDLEEPVDDWAPVYVIDDHIAQVHLPRLYKAADAFVLPSRGEGWGRPLVEAMAMSLPVIATNWSGPTEYLTNENSYPISVDELSEVKDGPFKGHLWAEPSLVKLRSLMRSVVNNPEDAKAKGRRARDDMSKRFSPGAVAQILINQLQFTVDNMGD